ncbi:hypothetical protein LSO9J_260008 [Candidatus Liberibacter solanacearum]|uniref:DUF4011 domain-containing protein n=1 Tax=Candidatus Liberibacter solanacearum TaxID=556287 RepID=UPI003872548E
MQDIDVKYHAKKLGIATKWETQVYADPNKKKIKMLNFKRYYIQICLNRLVRRISSKAKTAVEETGVNMLFLCTGFLKKSDANNSNIFYDAPLITITIEIEHDKIINPQTGFANFYVKENIIDNIYLQEKLKQFSITLPSFEKFHNEPEKYFSALTDILQDIKPEWKIQRYITMGFLSFGKMIMYQDLDSTRWPEVNGISEPPHYRYF